MYPAKMGRFVEKLPLHCMFEYNTLRGNDVCHNVISVHIISRSTPILIWKMLNMVSIRT